MAIVTYKPAAQTPNYLMLPQRPGDVSPNKTAGVAAKAFADVLEQAISSADEVQKQWVDAKARDTFERLNAKEEGDLKEQLRQGDEQLNDGGQGGFYSGDLSGPSVQPIKGEGGQTTEPASGGAEAALPEGSNPAQGPDGVKLEDQPVPIQNSFNKLISINQATQQGKFYDTGRQMEGEKELSALKAQFPGRAAQIDALGAHYGITANKGVSTLRQMVNEQQQRLQQKQNKDEAWEEKNRGWLVGDPASGRPGVDPLYFQRPEAQRRSAAFRNRLDQEIGTLDGTLKQNELATSNLALKNATLEDKRKETERILASDMQVRMAAGVLSILRKNGYTGGGQDIGQAMDEFTNQLVGTKDSKGLELLQQQLGAYMTTFTANEQRLANQRVIHSDGTTALGLVTPEGVAKIAQSVLIPVAGIRDNITNPQSGMLSSFGRMATAAADQSKYAITQHPMYQEAETAGYLRKQYGDDVFRQFYEKQKVDPKTGINPMSVPMQSLMEAAKLSIANGTKNPVTNTGLKFSDTINDATNTFKLYGGAIPPAKDVNGMLENLHQGIMNEKLPPEVRARFADSIFGDPKLPSLLKPEDTFTFLQRYAQPNVGEAIYKFNNPELTQNYEKTMLTVTKQALNEKVGNLKEAQGGLFSDKFISENLAYNSKTNRVDATVPDTNAIVSKFGPARGVVLDYQAQKIRDAVPVINQTLSFLDPIFKREGAEKVGPAIYQTILGAGMPIKGLEGQDGGTTTNTGGKGDKGAEPSATQSSVFQRNDANTAGLPPEYLTPTNDVSDKPLGYMMPNGTFQPISNAQQAPQGNFLPANSQPVEQKPVKTETIQGPQGRFEELQQMKAPVGKQSNSELPANATPAAYTAEAPQAQGEAQAAISDAISNKSNPLHDILRRAEGVKGQAGYNTVIGGDRYNLTNMTIKEVLQLQKELPSTGAVGAGQFIPKTLRSLVKEMGLTGEEKFSPQLQDAMIDRLLDRRGYSEWKAGKISDNTFINRLAQEWAGLPDTSGKSYYEGIQGNKANVTLASVKNALERHRRQ